MSEKQTSFLEEEGAYEKAAVPFADREAANKALDEFFAELYELRNKYRLANVSVVIRDSISGEGAFLVNAHFGNQVELEGMAAYLYGQAVKERQATMSKLLGMDSVIKSQRKQ